MSIVIGVGFGDEGKGLTTSWLCDKHMYDNPIVVRFNGSSQAGHCVNFNNTKHIFSSFGSGTLQGVPTYWSSFCPFDPISFLNEYQHLKKYNPFVYVNPKSFLITPFDVLHNQKKEKEMQNGSVGMGFGATIQRQQDYFKLDVNDMYYPTILKEKIENIAYRYYNTHNAYYVKMFLDACLEVRNHIKLVDDGFLKGRYCIFEGAQGVLLDMDHGFFPYVTRSNTTSKNAVSIYPHQERKIYYVTRSYLTRHGAGNLPNERKLNLKNNQGETNKTHEYQGEFRTAPFNLELLIYALKCDFQYSEGFNRNLVITCLDQWDLDVSQLRNDLLQQDIVFNEIYTSHGNTLQDIKLVSSRWQ